MSRTRWRRAGGLHAEAVQIPSHQVVEGVQADRRSSCRREADDARVGRRSLCREADDARIDRQSLYREVTGVRANHQTSNRGAAPFALDQDHRIIRG